MLPTDGVTTFESGMWEMMDTDPDKYEVTLRELVHVALDHMAMERVSSRGIMGKQTLDVRLTSDGSNGGSSDHCPHMGEDV